MSQRFFASQNMPAKGNTAAADQGLALMIKAVHEASRERYESPRVQGKICRIRVRSSAKRSGRRMREEGLAGRSKFRFIRTTVRDTSCKPAEKIVTRDFPSTKPNGKWVTSILYLPTKEGWVFLALVIDLFRDVWSPTRYQSIYV